MLFPSSRNSGPCDRGSGDALTALEFSSVTRLLYRERQDREGQGRRDLESFPTQAGKIASVQVIQSELARAGHELLQALRQSGHVAIDPHRPIRNLTQVFIILPQMQVVIENLRPRVPVLGRMLGEVSVVHPLT